MLFAVMVNVVHLGTHSLICLEFQIWQLFCCRDFSLNRNENIIFINFYGNASGERRIPTIESVLMNR